MNFEQFGAVRIFRPSAETESFVRSRAREHLFSRFAPGEHRGAQEVNAIVQHQYRFYEQMLHVVLPRITNHSAVEFLLFQYDEAWSLLHGRGIIDLHERQKWEWTEPLLKRAIKILLEQICLNPSVETKKVTPDQAVFAMEVALICAESMVHLSHESDWAHSVFPEDCIISIHASGPLFFEISVGGRHVGFDRRFADRVSRDRQSRDKFVGFPQFDHHTATHQRYLDDSFSTSFGMTYGEFIAAIKTVIESSQPSLHPHSFPTLFVRRSNVIDELAKSGHPRNAIEYAIDGFSISRPNLIATKRAPWNPKQEHRAYRRGFFVFPHETGPHLAFSRDMAKESAMQLVFWICFKHLPEEWRTAETTRALGPLAKAAGSWFEGIVQSNLRSLGIHGQRIHRAVGQRDLQIRVPDSVGEIDFLGYDPAERLLIIAEAKMVMTGLEGRYWRDDVAEFVIGPRSYAERFRRKIAWVSENRKQIAHSLGLESVPNVAAVMLTLYPCIASEFITDFPCVSLAEFMLDYGFKSKWPYRTL